MPLPFAGLHGSTTHGHTADYGALRAADEAEALHFDVGKVGSMLQHWRDYAEFKRAESEGAFAAVSHDQEARAAKANKTTSRYVADRAHTTHLDLYDEMPMTLAAEVSSSPHETHNPAAGTQTRPPARIGHAGEDQ